jgi:hypothetical protein
MKENPWARLLAYVTGLINQELLSVDLSVANYKIGLNSGIFGDFDRMPACTTSSSFSFIRSSPSSGL